MWKLFYIFFHFERIFNVCVCVCETENWLESAKYRIYCQGYGTGSIAYNHSHGKFIEKENLIFLWRMPEYCYHSQPNLYEFQGNG